MSTILIEGERVEYARRVFTNAGVLGRTLLSKLSKSWEAEVISDTPIPDTHSFEAGGVGMRSSSIDALAEMLSKQLSVERTICILHDESRIPTDPCLLQYAWPVFQGNDVYHLIPSFSSVDFVRRSIVEAESGVYLSGVVAQLEDYSPPNPRSMVTEEEVTRWGLAARYSLIEICDGETFLVWEHKYPQS